MRSRSNNFSTDRRHREGIGRESRKARLARPHAPACLLPSAEWAVADALCARARTTSLQIATTEKALAANLEKRGLLARMRPPAFYQAPSGQLLTRYALALEQLLY